MHTTLRSPIRMTAAGLVVCVALAGCGSDSTTTSQSDATTTVATASTGAATSTTADSATSSPTTAMASATPSGAASQITFTSICSFAPLPEIEAATGLSGLVAQDGGPPTSDHPEALCKFDTSATPTSSGYAALSYDPSLSVSYAKQPNDHGLHGFAIDVPSASDIQFGTAHPGSGRGVIKVSWVVQGHPVYLRLNETAADGAKTIAEAQQINARFPA